MPSDNTALQLEQFKTQIAAIPCAITLKQWQEINAIRNPGQQSKARAGIPQSEIDALGEIEIACTAELARLGSIYKKNSMFSAVSKYRRYLKAKGLDNHPVLAFFKMRKKDYSDRRGAYTRKINKRMSEYRPLFNSDGYISRAEWLLESDSYINVTMGLCALTGRRPGEILATASFEKTGEYSARFGGQLKTKDSENARDNYEIYLLTSADNVIAAISKLRKMNASANRFDASKVRAEETHGQMVSRLTANAQLKSARHYFLEFIPDYIRSNGQVDKLRAYDLRPAYASLAWEFFGDDWLDKNESLDADDITFFAEILGHSKDDTNTARSYKVFTTLYIDIENPFIGEKVSAKMLKE